MRTKSIFFASYKGDVAENDFKEFEKLDEILFLNETRKIDYEPINN